MENYLLFIRFY